MYTHILVAVDGSNTSKLALAEAIKLAHPQKTQVRLIHVIDQTMSTYEARGWVGDEAALETLLKAAQEAGVKVLEEASKICQEAGLDFQTAMPKTLGAGIADILLEEAGRWPADLIVLGTHGRKGIQHLMLGSVAERVMRRAKIPVLLVRES